VAWSRAQNEIREVSLIAQDLSGFQALVARPLLEGLSRTVLELPGLPQRSWEEIARWPETIDLPGLEQFGGLKAAAALSAPTPLWLYGNLRAFDTSWAKSAYEYAGGSQVLRMDAGQPTPVATARWIDRGE
jgi:hypothetical protein